MLRGSKVSVLQRFGCDCVGVCFGWLLKLSEWKCSKVKSIGITLVFPFLVFVARKGCALSVNKCGLCLASRCC